MTPSSRHDSPRDPSIGGLHGAAEVERHLAELEVQVRQLQRQAALGTMSAMLAHEFNNLLTPLIGYCQYAQANPEPANLRKAVDKTVTAAARIKGLCERVMGLASDDAADGGPVALRTMVTDTLEGLGRELAKDRITTAIEIPPDLRVGGAAGLQQVLLNLVINARQAMLGTGGSLILRASRRADGAVEIAVIDSGPGIAPENLERIFEPFFTTKRGESSIERQGMGLGLAVCRRIMSEMGGEIRVASEPGRGATFTLVVPRQTAP